MGGLLDILLLFPSIMMFGYTFRLNEINVFYHQQMIEGQNKKGKNDYGHECNHNKSFSIRKISDFTKLFDREVNNVSKYTKYIAANYFWISYKTMFYVIADGL